ncbi:MAG: Rrf2 family transcriptional regulator [Chloroflexi bacterium]|nr:Rrf2 family transcriptional regulator [Chloroflexota bacterium]
MKISTRGRYAIRGLADLASNGKDGPISIREIAERQEVSVDYMEQLFHKLMKAGIIKSFRGLKGGYQLAKDPGDISIKDILEIVEGPLCLVNCEEMEGSQACPRMAGCKTHILWNKLTELIAERLDEIKLKDVCEGTF